jgi:hypothetical protein
MRNPGIATRWLLCAVLVLVAAAAAQSHQDPGSKGSSGAMQREMQNSAPGPVHKHLAMLAGNYQTVTRFYAEPGAQPVESIGTASISSVLGGRFMLEQNSSTFMGQPASGIRLIGYNNASEQYEAIWTYTMSTAIMRMSGASDDGGKNINFDASWDKGAGKRQDVKVAIHRVDDDQFVVELIAKLPDGKLGPGLVTTYLRKK